MKRKNLNEITESLFLIDMNNGFCDNNCNLGDETIKNIVPYIQELIEDNIAKGEALFIVNDNHSNTSVELKRFLPHCDNEYESKTIKELATYEKYATKIFSKNSTCALFAKGVIETLLAMPSLKKVIITGCCTDICIMNFAVALRNFFDELNLDIEIVVPMNAVETYNLPSIHDRDEYNALGFKVMAQNGIKLIKTKKEGN